MVSLQPESLPEFWLKFDQIILDIRNDFSENDISSSSLGTVKAKIVEAKNFVNLSSGLLNAYDTRRTKEVMKIIIALANIINCRF